MLIPGDDLNLGTRHACPPHAGPVEPTVQRLDTTLRGHGSAARELPDAGHRVVGRRPRAPTSGCTGSAGATPRSPARTT